jgi:hypothetical protein
MGAERTGVLPESKRLCLSGDEFFRQSKFEEAEQSYSAALAADRGSARGHWGLGRIAALTAKETVARDHFSAAYQLDSLDPDIVLSYADYVTNAAARCVLWRNYLLLAGTEGGSARREDVLARLEIAERLGDRQAGKLASSYRRYRFALAGFFPDGRDQRGVLLKVRINGGKPLRLVLDSGTPGIVISPYRVPAGSLPVLADSRVAGFGHGGGVPAQTALAESVSIDDLRLENCLIQIAGRELVHGADGVIGLGVFRDFLLQIDLRANLLDLIPYGGSVDSARVTPLPIYRLSHLILLREATAAGGGYYLFDTGSSFSAKARDSAYRAGNLPETRLRGAGGEFLAHFLLPPMHLACASERFVDEHPVALDLRAMSQAAGAEIAGIAGFPLFRKSTILLDCRHGWIQFQK